MTQPPVEDSAIRPQAPPSESDDLLTSYLCGATLVLGVATLLIANQERNGILIMAAAVVMAVPLWYPTLPLKVSPLGAAVVFGLSASLVVTAVANGPARESYWPVFFLWLAGMCVPVIVAYRTALGAAPRTVPEFCATHRREIAIVGGLTVAAFLVRVVNVAGLPAPFSGDEARFLLQGLEVKDGILQNMFVSGYQGHPNMFVFSLAGLMTLFGESVFATRLYGVILGTLSVPAVYLLLRHLFDKRVALIGASLLVTYHFALHYSRQNMNNIGDLPYQAGLILLLWLALSRTRPRDYLLTGLFAGLGLYGYAGARAAIALILAVCVLALFHLPRSQWRVHFLGVGFIAAGFLLAAAPLALFWFNHPEEFSNRLAEVGIFQSGWLERESEATGQSEVSLLWQQVTHNLGVFGYYADRSIFYEGPEPIVERVALPFLLLGTAVTLARISRLSNQLMFLGFAVVVATGGVLTVGSPASHRLLGTVPAITAMVSVGIAASIDAGTRAGLRPHHTLVFSALIVAAISGFNLFYYFHTYARGDYYSDFNTRIATEGAAYLRSLPAGTPVFWYGAPNLPASHPSALFGLRGLPLTEALKDGTFLTKSQPTPGSAGFVFTRGWEAEKDRIVDLCPGGALGTVVSRKEEFMFWTYLSPPETDCALVVTGTR